MRRSSVHSPSVRPKGESALEHVRRISREHNKPFDPSQRGTWRGSSKDLVVNGHRRGSAGDRNAGVGSDDREEFVLIDKEPDDRHPYVLVNPLGFNDSHKASLFAMHFGAYGNTCLLVWGDHLESALETAAEWLAQYTPGHIADETDIQTLMKDFPDLSDEEAYEKATADLTYTESGYLVSYEWTVDELPKSSELYKAALEASKEEYAEEYGEQAPNKRGMKRNSRIKNGTPLADDTGLLLELVRSAAESQELNARYADVTEEVYEEARKYDTALAAALEELVRKHPPKGGATADDLWNTNAPYLVLMTLQGQGVGIWDGDWDVFYSDTKPAEKFLKQKLHRFADDSGAGSLNEAFDNAAYQTAGTE